MTRGELIAFEDGLEYDGSTFTLCENTSNVSTAPAPGLHMADQNAINNEHDARADGEEDLLNEHDYEVPLMASSSSVLPSAAWRGEELDGATVLPTIDGSAGEDDVDVGTRDRGDANASILCATTTTSIEYGRSTLNSVVSSKHGATKRASGVPGLVEQGGMEQVGHSPRENVGLWMSVESKREC
ncbi:predicted protein [Postia placenta Mad-698-R]|nr:predicted protein [Postia placenta Mad-698-R]